MFVLASAVGAVGVPVKAGDSKGAFVLISVWTNSVVAICVVLVPEDAVGAAGVPVNSGESRGAFNAKSSFEALASNCVWIALVTPWTYPSSVDVVADSPILPLLSVIRALSAVIASMLLRSWYNGSTVT